MTARNDTYALMQQLGARNISLSFDEVNTLRRAQLTLHRWAEQECGDDNGYASYCISRDEESGLPFLEWHPHDGHRSTRSRIADREAGALRRVKATAQQVGLSQAERALNVQGAFRVPAECKGEVAGRRLVLIDDVLTSGATSDACARALLRAGAKSVDVVVFARVVDAVRTPI